MPRVIKGRGWNRKRDPKKGLKLQKLANQMLLKHEITQEYFRIRRAAEFHLGFWDWQKKSYNFGNPNTDRPHQCININCGYLPVGSVECRRTDHVCP